MPGALKGVDVDVHYTDYGKSVAAAGGVPIELTRDADVASVVAILDGLILSGGADVEPSRYGAEPHPRLGTVESDRDEWELALLDAALAAGLPVLGICRGAQLTNVYFGGTLHQHHESGEGSDHPRFGSDGRRRVHDVVLEPDSRLGALLGVRLGVNSLHHQSIDQVGEGLRVVGRADDGVVEAIEAPERDLLAVQWHPELLGGPDPTFGWLVERAASYAAAKE